MELAEKSPKTDKVKGYVIAATLGALAGMLPSARILDTDVYWQIRAGEETLQGVALMRPDTWSYMPLTHTWAPNSPLWNTFLYLTWWSLHGWGLVLLGGLLGASLYLLVVRLALKAGAHIVPTLIALAIVTPILMPALVPRATLIANLLLLASISLLPKLTGLPIGEKLTIAAGVRVFASFCLVTAFGLWLHMSWVGLSLILLIAWVTQLAFQGTKRWELIAQGALALGGVVLGVALGPYRGEVFQQARNVQEASVGLIIEWQSPFKTIFYTTYLILGMLLALLLTWGVLCQIRKKAETSQHKWWKEHLGTSPTLVGTLVPALILLTFGAMYIRFLPWAFVLLIPASAKLVTTIPKRGLTHWKLTPSGFSLTILALIGFLALPLWSPLSQTHGEPDGTSVVKALPQGCKLLSSGSASAQIILLRPDVKVWFDGRNDYWGRDRTLSYMSLMNGQPDKVGQEALRQATCALLPLFGTFQGAEVEKLIQNDPSWKQIPTSDPYHLYIKTSLISPNAA